MTLKQYCEQNNLDQNKVFNMVLARGGDILPTVTAFTGYIAEIRDECLVCTNDKLKLKYQKQIDKELGKISSSIEFFINNIFIK